MKKNSLAVGAALLATIAFGIFIWISVPREPKYNGRTLTSWLDEWGGSFWDPTNAAADAIRAIGTNGLPLFIGCVSEEKLPLQLKIYRLTYRYLPNDLNPWEYLRDRHSSRAVAAAYAINSLGSNAQSAFPTLTNLLTRQSSEIPAAIALAGMGHDGVAVLLQALINQDWMLRLAAAGGLAMARSDFDKVIPALFQATQIVGNSKEDYLVRRDAAGTFLVLQKNTKSVVPVLCAFLTNEDPEIRSCGAVGLGGYGSDAKVAIPLLRTAALDSDSGVRKAAMAALTEIDPVDEGAKRDKRPNP